jgi:hypothetical protein
MLNCLTNQFKGRFGQCDAGRSSARPMIQRRLGGIAALDTYHQPSAVLRAEETTATLSDRFGFPARGDACIACRVENFAQIGPGLERRDLESIALGIADHEPGWLVRGCERAGGGAAASIHAAHRSASIPALSKSCAWGLYGTRARPQADTLGSYRGWEFPQNQELAPGAPLTFVPLLKEGSQCASRRVGAERPSRGGICLKQR